MFQHLKRFTRRQKGGRGKDEKKDYGAPEGGSKKGRKIVKPQPPSTVWACAAGPHGSLPCKILHKDRRPYTIMALAAGCPVARIPHNLLDDRYDEVRCCSLPCTFTSRVNRACVLRAYTCLLDPRPRCTLPRNNGAGITKPVGVRCNPPLSLFVLFRPRKNNDAGSYIKLPTGRGCLSAITGS